MNMLVEFFGKFYLVYVLFLFLLVNIKRSIIKFIKNWMNELLIVNFKS